MNVSSSLAGRLGVKGQKLGRITRTDRSSDVSRVSTKSTAGLGGALAHRLGVPSSTVGSSLSVGIKARLGLGARRAVFKQSPAQQDQIYSPYPTEKGLSAGAVNAERRRRNIRTADLSARRGIEAGDMSSAVLPARVKMSSGRVVGGMRSDLIREHSGKKKKRLQPPSPEQGTRPVVAMDATRGLTVSVHNSRRRAPYSQHDDRALPHAKYSRSLDWESEDDVGLQFQGGRRHRMYSGDPMDVDSGEHVYNASLLFTTRTTTHHHHHHHHGPPSPSPPPARTRPPLTMRARSPSPHPPFRRDSSPRRALAAAPSRYLRDSRYLSQDEPFYSEDYSPPPPPSPPSFHPRYRGRDSPSPSGYIAQKAKRAAPKLAKPYLKPGKAVKRTKLMKPAKKVKKVKASKSVKSKKLKQLRSNRSSSLDTVSSESDSSSSSSSSSDSSSSSKNARQATYKAPKERVLPEPHKQVLDPQVRKSIASLQGKDPESKSGPGPGIKDLVFVPSKTNKSLNQRFTFPDASR